jgi:hypothetical protein
MFKAEIELMSPNQQLVGEKMKEFQVYILGDMKAKDEDHALSKLGKYLFNVGKKGVNSKSYEHILKGKIEIKPKD